MLSLPAPTHFVPLVFFSLTDFSMVLTLMGRDTSVDIIMEDRCCKVLSWAWKMCLGEGNERQEGGNSLLSPTFFLNSLIHPALCSQQLCHYIRLPSTPNIPCRAQLENLIDKLLAETSLYLIPNFTSQELFQPSSNTTLLSWNIKPNCG